MNKRLPTKNHNSFYVTILAGMILFLYFLGTNVFDVHANKIVGLADPLISTEFSPWALDSNLAIYADSLYGFTIKYPENWAASVTITNGGNTPGVIEQRLLFSFNNYGIIIDIFPNDPDTNINDWYVEYQQQFMPVDGVVQENLVVAGLPALYALNPGTNGMLPRHTLILLHDSYIFRIEYQDSNNGKYLDTYETMLTSLSFSDGDRSVPVKLFNLTGIKINSPIEEVHPQVQSCFQYTDPNPNHFECGTGGNCTWWAKYKRPDTGGQSYATSWGNATYWKAKAREEGFRVDHIPVKKAIMVNVDYNHVAYVESIDPVRGPYMSDMDWGNADGNLVDYYYTKPENIPVLWFIHPRSLTPPTNVDASDDQIGKIIVTWSPVTNATKYEVWRYPTNAPSAAILLSSTAVSPFEDKTVVTGKYYNYWLKACNSNECSVFSLRNRGISIPPPPPSFTPTRTFTSTSTPTLTATATSTFTPSMTPKYRVYLPLVIKENLLQPPTPTYTPTATPFTTLFYLKPALNPAYTGNLCTAGWLRINGWQSDYSYLTLNTNQAANSGYTATYSLTVEKTGNYRLSNWVADHQPIGWSCPTKTINSDSSKTPFRVNHANGQAVVYVNQVPITDNWATVGTYSFNAGVVYKIIIFDLNTEADWSTTISAGTMRAEYVP